MAGQLSALNFYAGGIVGIGEVEERFKVFSLAQQHEEVTPFRGSSFLGGGALGVEHYFGESYYLALEGNGQYNTYKKAVHVQTSSTSKMKLDLQNRFIYGIDLKAGVPLTICGVENGTTPYILGGIQAGPWKKSLFNPPGAPDQRFKFFKHLWGTKLGGGVRFRVLCVDVDLQYSYAWFNRFKTPYVHRTSVNLQSILLSFNVPFFNLL